MKKRCISLLLSLCFCISTGTVIPAYAQNTSPDVKVFYSSYNDLDNTYKLTDLTQDKNIQFSHVWDAISEGTAGIVVDPSVTYQTWEGFGGSLDGATIYYLNQLEQSDYEQALLDLFDDTSGNGYDLMRLSIGCSDFTIDAPEAGDYGPYGVQAGNGYWTYNDTVDEDTDGDGVPDADTDLSCFSIQRDVDANIISTLKDILQVNPNVRFFASMWSAPAWMKKNGDIVWKEGQPAPELKDEYYDLLAEYYCKFIMAYEERGIPIEAVTLQNEPDVKIGYPCMTFTPENQIKFATALAAKFSQHNIETKIWGLDANEFQTWNYAVPLLESNAAVGIDGIGFHNYGGITMYYPRSLQQQYPGISTHITEMTVGANKLVEYMRNGINSYAYWITYYDLDMQNRTYGPGPSFWSKPQSDDADHWSLSQLSNNGSGGYQKNAKYYVFGQFSRFVKTGAVHISSSESDGNISNVAFKNPDGSIAVVVVNRAPVQNTNVDPNTPDQDIQIMTPDGMFRDTIPGDTIATYVWQSSLNTPLSKDGWSASATASYSGYFPFQAIDGLSETLWLTGENQNTSHEFVLDMGATKSVNAVVLNLESPFFSDYPGSYRAYCSTDGTTWDEVIAGTGSPGVTSIRFSQEIQTRYIKIELTASADHWWSISELAVYGDEVPAFGDTPYEMIMDKSSWTVQASSNRATVDYASQVIDNDLTTSWIHQDAQRIGNYLELTLVNAQNIDCIVIDSGDSPDYGRKYECFLSMDGLQWNFAGTVTVIPKYDDSGTILSTAAALILEEPAQAKYVRVQLAQDTLDHWWEVAEITLYQEVPPSGADRTDWFSVSELFQWSDYSQAMFDGQPDTRWTSSKAQAPGDSVNFDMQTMQTFEQIVIESGSDYARGLKVLASKDGVEYTQIAQTTDTSDTTVITFDQPQSAKCIRLELTEGYDTAWWSIYELNLVTACEAAEVQTSVTWLHGTPVETNAVDGDVSTTWTANENQMVSADYTSSFLLNLGESRSVVGLSINTGPQMWDYLETYEIYAWNDGEQAQLIAKGTGCPAVTIILFAEVTAKYVWIRAGENASRPFTIAELDLYARISGV